jgi:hypothetical protein
MCGFLHESVEQDAVGTPHQMMTWVRRLFSALEPKLDCLRENNVRGRDSKIVEKKKGENRRKESRGRRGVK